MKVLVFEPDHGGHRFGAVRLLLDALRDIVPEVALALGPGAAESDEFAVHLSPIADRLRTRVVPFNHGRSPSAVARSKLQALTTLLKEGDYDHLYVPYADGLAQLSGLARLLPAFRWPASVVGEALMMRGNFAYPGSARPGDWLKLRALQWSPFARIHWIDPVALRRLRQRYPALGERSSLIPDPTPATVGVPRETARRRLGIPIDGRYVGLVGRIDERKGADLLLRAFRRARLMPRDRLILAGRHSPGIRALLGEAACENIVSLDAYLGEDDLLMATSAIDLMATPYPDFVGSVSICIRAAGVGRMCLGADQGWMGYVIPAFDLGTVCAVNRTDEFAAAIELALAQSTVFSLSAKGRRFVSYHQPENVHAAWTDLIRRRLGMAQGAAAAWPDES